MPDYNDLPDVSTLNNIETSFKVYAGPGAGKTSWLIDHLEKVLKKSNRLERTKQIACITYTNVAAEEIIKRLDCDRFRFDISTIHSFLYRNIIKPFSYFIEKDDQGNNLFDISRLDGHEEHVVHGDRLRRWLHTIGEDNGKNYRFYSQQPNVKDVVIELSSLDFIFDGGQVELIIRKNRGARIPRSNRELWKYKLKYWADGIMHHEDVLYFSYLILSENPEVLKFIRNKFPYIFVDEFQDTTQLQTWILDKISEEETLIGVVGDVAQSIYKFTGAQRNDFITFKEENITEYKIGQNHRSTTNIIDFLNFIRTDINQEYGDEYNHGDPVRILVGTPIQALEWFKQNYDGEIIFTLTRKNATIFEISNKLGSVSEDLVNDMYSNDSDAQRPRLIHSILKAIKFHDKQNYLDSLKEITRHLKRVNDGTVLKIELRDIAINLINNLDLDKREKSLFEVYMNLKSKVSGDFGLNIGAGLRSGKAKNFYASHTVNQLLPHVKVDTRTDDTIRTIHSAKGTEFDNTLVHFESLDDFRKYILNGAHYLNQEDDDGRIYYVACSRSKRKLFINIPEITQSELYIIDKMPILVEELN